MLSLSVFPEMSKGLTQYLIKFFKETSCECLTAVTVVAEVLTKYMYDLKKDELKRVVEQSITSISYIIDDKKKAKLLEINLKVILFWLIYNFLILRMMKNQKLLAWILLWWCVLKSLVSVECMMFYW